MHPAKILVVEDEPSIQELLQVNLERGHYRLKIVDSGEEALRVLSDFKPDLILLDIMLPGLDGLEVCKRVMADGATRAVPVIMLTALGSEADIVTGLELGACDYVTKPFSPRILLARIKAALRREAAEPSDDSGTLSLHGICIDPARHLVTVEDRAVELTYTEFKVLQHLAGQPGRVFTRFQIVDAVHGENHPVTDRSVDVQIVGLRKKLGEAGRCIETVRGIGYRFREKG